MAKGQKYQDLLKTFQLVALLVKTEGLLSILVLLPQKSWVEISCVVLYGVVKLAEGLEMKEVCLINRLKPSNLWQLLLCF